MDCLLMFRSFCHSRVTDEGGLDDGKGGLAGLRRLHAMQAAYLKGLSQ